MAAAQSFSEDWFAFYLESGANVGVNLSKLTPGNLTVDVFNSSGSWLAQGALSENLDAAISGLVADYSGFYLSC